MHDRSDGKRFVTGTQLLLYTLREAGAPLSLHDLMRTADQIADRLRAEGFEIEVFFRSPYCGNVWSEGFERSIWYWLSNRFVEEDPKSGDLSLSESGRKLFADRDLFKAINRSLDEQALAEVTSVIRQAVGARGA